MVKANIEKIIVNFTLITIVLVVNKYIIEVDKYIITGEGLFMSELMTESSNDLIRLADLNLDYSSG